MISAVVIIAIFATITELQFTVMPSHWIPFHTMCETPLYVRSGSYTKQVPLEHLSHIKQMPLEHLSYIKKTSCNKAVHKVERSSLTVAIELLKVWKYVTRFINGSAGATIRYNYDFASWVVPFTSIAPIEGRFVSAPGRHKIWLCRRTLLEGNVAVKKVYIYVYIYVCV